MSSPFFLLSLWLFLLVVVQIHKVEDSEDDIILILTINYTNQRSMDVALRTMLTYHKKSKSLDCERSMIVRLKLKETDRRTQIEPMA